MSIRKSIRDSKKKGENSLLLLLLAFIYKISFCPEYQCCHSMHSMHESGTSRHRAPAFDSSFVRDDVNLYQFLDTQIEPRNDVII